MPHVPAAAKHAIERSGLYALQVMDWTQRVLAIGESFSGVECAGLRTLLQRQSGNFFQAYHTSNVEVRLGLTRANKVHDWLPFHVQTKYMIGCLLCGGIGDE